MQCHHAEGTHFCAVFRLRGFIAAPKGGEKHGFEQEVFAHGGGGGSGDNGRGGKNPGGEKKGSSGGGCDAGFGGLALALAAAFLLKKKA